MGVIKVWLDLDTGKTEAVTRSRDADARGRWQVICEGDAVSILREGRGKLALIGSGRWTGDGVANRYAVSDPIEDRAWNQVEHGLRRALGGGAAAASSGSAPPASAEQPPTMKAELAPAPTPDRRSGWWAFAAAVVALIGTLASWRMMPPGDSIALAVTITLGVATLGLVIYGGVGLGTRCPRCRAWYRRETTSTDVLGTSTYTKQISKPVHDSSGKQIGTTYETATYERTNYRYHYRCKECSHRWTGTGSSERRIG